MKIIYGAKWDALQSNYSLYINAVVNTFKETMNYLPVKNPWY